MCRPDAILSYCYQRPRDHEAVSMRINPRHPCVAWYCRHVRFTGVRFFGTLFDPAPARVLAEVCLRRCLRGEVRAVVDIARYPGGLRRARLCGSWCSRRCRDRGAAVAGARIAVGCTGATTGAVVAKGGVSVGVVAGATRAGAIAGVIAGEAVAVPVAATVGDGSGEIVTVAVATVCCVGMATPPPQPTSARPIAIHPHRRNCHGPMNPAIRRRPRP